MSYLKRSSPSAISSRFSNRISTSPTSRSHLISLLETPRSDCRLRQALGLKITILENGLKMTIHKLANVVQQIFSKFWTVTYFLPRIWRSSRSSSFDNGKCGFVSALTRAIIASSSSNEICRSSFGLSFSLVPLSFSFSSSFFSSLSSSFCGSGWAFASSLTCSVGPSGGCSCDLLKTGLPPESFCLINYFLVWTLPVLQITYSNK